MEIAEVWGCLEEVVGTVFAQKAVVRTDFQRGHSLVAVLRFPDITRQSVLSVRKQSCEELLDFFVSGDAIADSEIPFIWNLYYSWDIGPGILLVEADSWRWCPDTIEALPYRLNRMAIEQFLSKYHDEARIIGHLLYGHSLSEDMLSKARNSPLWREEHETRVLEIGPHYGYVYVIKLGDTGYYKIGRSNNPDRRIWKEISPILPVEPKIIVTIETGDMITLEKKIHQRFADKRANGEWFTLSDENVEEIKEKWQTT